MFYLCHNHFDMASATYDGGGLLMVGGVRPRAHRGHWEVMHLYLPTALVSSPALDKNLILTSGALGLIDPQCARDDAEVRIHGATAAGMREGAGLSRLRVDNPERRFRHPYFSAMSNLSLARAPGVWGASLAPCKSNAPSTDGERPCSKYRTGRVPRYAGLSDYISRAPSRPRRTPTHSEGPRIVGEDRPAERRDRAAGWLR